MQGIDYGRIPLRERCLLTKFRCANCGLNPVYLLDLQHLNKVRCLVCSQIVNLKNRGKYGRIRKKVAIATFEMMKAGRTPSDLGGSFPDMEAQEPVVA